MMFGDHPSRSRPTVRVAVAVQIILLTAAWLAPSVAAVNTTSLVSWWPAEGSANDAHGANNGTMVNGAAFAAGIDGQGFNFDGVDDYVDLGQPANLMPTNTDFTVSGWFQIPDLANNGYPQCTANYPIFGTAWGWRVYVRYDGLVIFSKYVALQAGQAVVSAAPVTVGAWHHFAGIHRASGGANGVGQMAIYVDGVLSNTVDNTTSVVFYKTGSGTDLGTDKLLIGRGGCAGQHWNFKGQIDDLAIHNRELSANEVEAAFVEQGAHSPLVVDVTADRVDVAPGDGSCADSTGHCSLRAAVMEGNALPGPDTITVPAGTYTLTIGGTGENAAATGDLDINGDLTINGAGAATTIVDANDLDQLFDVRSATTTVEIHGLTMRDSSPPIGELYTGAIRSLGTLTVADSVMTSNVGRYGAAIANMGGTLTVSNTAVSGNSGYAAIYAQGGETTLDQGTSVTGTVGTGIWMDAAHLTVNDATVSGNVYSAVSGVGGIYQVNGLSTIANAVVSGNTGSLAGGIFNSAGTMTVTDSTVTGNTSPTAAGIGTKNSAALTVLRSTINANTGPGIQTGIGGGGGTLTVTNSTISGNTAGGIDLYGGNATTVNITSSTIHGNTATSGGGGIDGLAGGVITLRNSIIAGNTPADCGGATLTAGYNVEGDASCAHGASDLFNTDPHLGALAANGGPTNTHALLAGSPAIDLVPPASCAVTTDQRGVARPFGVNCDAGAFELEAVPDTTPPVVTPPADVSVAQTSPAGADVIYPDATATDDVDGSVPTDCTPASGSTFPPGIATVTCTAEDAAGNVGSATFTVSVATGGQVWAWGYGVIGQLGNGTTTAQQKLPVQASGLTDVVAVSAGYYYSLALRADGTVWAWGYGVAGQLGNGTTTVQQTTPVQVSGLTDVVTASAGYRHSLALRADGTVWAWGYGQYGQLGNGTATFQQTTPVQVSGLTDVVTVSAGRYHSLALRADGTVWAWGGGSNGQLGNGTTTWQQTTPVQVSGLTDVVTVSAGDSHSLALRADGTVWAWGYGYYGELGNGTFTYRQSTPVQASGLTEVVAVSAGYSHNLALRADGTVWTWGGGSNGQLGNGTTSYRQTTAIQASGLTDVVAVSAGDGHSLALRADGTVWAWGYGYYGQLGNGTTSDRLIPVPVLGIHGALAIAGGDAHTLAVAADSLNPIGKQVVGSVVPGGTRSSDSEGDGATPTQPVEASVTSPVAGTVSITTQSVTGTPSTGYAFVGQQVIIVAPAGTTASPLVLMFRIDASQISGPVSAIVVSRNGSAITDTCSGIGATPDPCVVSRVLLNDGDAEITIRTSHASTWTFALPVPPAPVQEALSAVLDQIDVQLSLPTNKHDTKKLTDARKKLADSLASDLWIDSAHVDAKKGEKVFQAHKEAVQKLVELVKDKKSSLEDFVLQLWVDQIVQSDRSLALTALGEAIAADADTKKIDQATKELDKADALLAAGKADDAIEHYKNAWKKAQEALRKI